MESITTGAWKALGGQNMQGVTTCFPATDNELYTAVTGPDCTVIMLTKNYFDSYHIEKEMFVTGRKVIIGNPLTLPLLNTTKVERIFHGKLRSFPEQMVLPCMVSLISVFIGIFCGSVGRGISGHPLCCHLPW